VKEENFLDGRETISVLIKRTSLEFDKIANTMLSPYHLTNTQFKILRYLAENPDLTITQRNLEHNFSMTNPAITGILQNLEKKGLIIRKVNPSDGRSKVIGLTDQSMSLSSDLAKLSQRMDNQFTESLTTDEKAQLTYLLQRIINNKSID